MLKGRRERPKSMEKEWVDHEEYGDLAVMKGEEEMETRSMLDGRGLRRKWN